MVRIACVGITVMDRIYYVEGLPTEGGKYVAKRYTEVGGGPAATAAVAAAKLGAQVDFIGRVGDDDTGNSLLAELESLGVNTRYTRRYTQAMSSQSAIMVDAKGERIIVNYPSPDLLPDADWLNDVDFSQWDVVLADVRWHDGAKQAFILARQAGVMTVLDGDITPQDISELVALSDHAAFSEPGLARLTGMSETIDALKKAQTLTNGHVYVTRGSEGCNWVGKSGGTPPTGFYRGGGGYYRRGRCFSRRSGIWPGKRIRHRGGCQIRQRRCRAEVYAPRWSSGYP
nr:putative sugar kinase [Salmonella sp. NCTC 7297]